jgi:serine/threonine-protein kinase
MAASNNARALAEKRVGQVLRNKFTIERVIDIGGMAAVFAATHRNGKRVAIKMLHPYIATNADVRERFLREGYAANKVEHRGAVQILDDDTLEDGAVFIVMELLEGESLEKWMARAPEGRVPAHDVLAIADQVLDVLGAFHTQKVIHRDIKPGNLFITKDGVVKVLDFGLARLRDPRAGNIAPTGAGIVLGTVAYMPPEQAQGKSDAIDARSDLFAVGAVMFQALTGKLFIKGHTAIERLMNAMKDPAPKLASVLPGVPEYLADVVDTALAYDKTKRWADANDMRQAVRIAYSALIAEAQKRAGNATPHHAQIAPQAPPMSTPPMSGGQVSSKPKLQIMKEDSIMVVEGSAIFAPSIVEILEEAKNPSSVTAVSFAEIHEKTTVKTNVGGQ